MNAMLVVSICNLTECNQKRRFAYIPVLERPPNFDEIGLRQGLSRFYEEMRLNQIRIEYQKVTADLFRHFTPN